MYDLSAQMIDLKRYSAREEETDSHLEKQVDVSIVIPLLNEAESLNELYAQR